MKRLFLNRKLTFLILCMALTVVIGGIGAYAAVTSGLPGLDILKTAAEAEESEQGEPELSITPAGEESEPEVVIQPVVSETEQEIEYDRSERMMAVTLTAGVDYYTDPAMTDEQIMASVDSALGDAESLGANTVIFETIYGDKVLYRSSGMPQAEVAFDILNYAVSKAKSMHFYVYAVYDVLLTNEDGAAVFTNNADREQIKLIDSNLRQLVDSYEIDAVLLDSFTIEQGSATYQDYAQFGGGIGYENYLRSTTESAVETAYQSVKKSDPAAEVGLLVGPVWANSASIAEGSNTEADWESYGDGCADTKKFVESGYADFVAVKCPYAIGNADVSFTEYLTWWNGVVGDKIPLYAYQYASKACTKEKGWSEPAELSNQVIAAEGLSGFCGSMFDSVSALKKNPQQSTDALLQYLTDKTDPSFLLTQLEMTRPAKTTYSTFETIAIFAGASDINFPLTMNGEEVARDENGAFFLRIDLEPGTNTFTFEHKEKTIAYAITRQVQIIKEISPLGNVTINGGMDITISATAYEGASLTAKLGGMSVQLEESNEDDDDTDNESTYINYSGTITVPSSGSSAQKLGNIVVNATWGSSYSESATGAYVTVAAKAGDGDLVKVTANSAETFPTGTLNDLSDYDCYPLPKGALDYTDGGEIVYKEGDNTFTYYNLQSGQRVYSKDVTKAGSEDLGGNSVNGVTVNANGRYTYVIFSMDQRVSYVAKYSSGAFTIDFQYTSDVPDNLSLTKNPLFSSANWSGSKVTLKLNTTNGFLGYYAYFDGDDLIFRFNNPTGESSVDGVTTVVDVGHSKLGVGALGFLSAYGEYEINLAVGGYLKKELKNRGATVYLLDTEKQRPSLADRVAYAESAKPLVFVSVHCNSSTSSSGKGTECWHFNRFSGSLASYFSDAVSDALNTTNRGAMIGRYYVTRVSQYAAVLGELGFVSSESDYYKLIKSSYQKEIAEGIADAVESYLGAVGKNGNYKYGTQYVGEKSSIPDDDYETPPDEEKSSSAASSSKPESSSSAASSSKPESSSAASSSKPESSSAPTSSSKPESSSSAASSSKPESSSAPESSSGGGEHSSESSSEPGSGG